MKNSLAFIGLVAFAAVANGGILLDDLFPQPAACSDTKPCDSSYQVCFTRPDGSFCLTTLKEGEKCNAGKYPYKVCQKGLECKYDSFWDRITSGKPPACRSKKI